MAELFIDETNLYEINYLLTLKNKPPATMDDLKAWLPSQVAILDMENSSNKLYILESLNNAFAGFSDEYSYSIMPRFDPYRNEVYVTSGPEKKIDMKRRPSKRYLSEAKGLHARLSTLEDQMDSITLDEMMSKKMLEI